MKGEPVSSSFIFLSQLQMVLSTPKPSGGEAMEANREVPHLTLDGENSIVMEYVAPGLTATQRMYGLEPAQP